MLKKIAMPWSLLKSIEIAIFVVFLVAPMLDTASSSERRVRLHRLRSLPGS